MNFATAVVAFYKKFAVTILLPSCCTAALTLAVTPLLLPHCCVADAIAAAVFCYHCCCHHSQSWLIAASF